MKSRTLIAVAIAVLFAATRVLAEDEHANGPHHDGVDHRGDHGMGFSHEKTTHNFTLTKSGGVVSADAKDANDAASRDAIRKHFRHISASFKKGDFAIPRFIHGKLPPGAATMKKLASEISYQMEETPAGGRVVIRSENPDALAAIHQFLRFQITDHRTGDSLDVKE